MCLKIVHIKLLHKNMLIRSSIRTERRWTTALISRRQLARLVVPNRIGKADHSRSSFGIVFVQDSQKS